MQGRGAHRVQATVWPVVSEPAMKKTANSSISLARVRGLPSLSLSLSRCPAWAQALRQACIAHQQLVAGPKMIPTLATDAGLFNLYACLPRHAQHAHGIRSKGS